MITKMSPDPYEGPKSLLQFEQKYGNLFAAVAQYDTMTMVEQQWLAHSVGYPIITQAMIAVQVKRLADRYSNV